MALPTIPATHRWIDGGAAIRFVGNAITGAGSDATMYCWDRDTDLRVTDLYDQDGQPCTEVPVRQNSFYCAVPNTVAKPVFSVGSTGARFAGNDWQTGEVTTQAAADAATSAQAAIDASNLVGAPADTAVNTLVTPGSGSATEATLNATYDAGSVSTLYVEVGGNDSASGKTHNTAKATLAGALSALGANPGRIVVGPGTHLIGARFSNTVPVTIDAHPGTVFQCNFTDTTNGIFYPQAALTLNGGTIDGVGVGFGLFGIKIDGIVGVRLRDVLIRNTQHFGVYVTGAADDVIFDGVTVDSCGDASHPTAGGFYNSSSGNVTWSNCTASNNYAQGWYNDGDGTIGVTTLSNVWAFGNGAYGIDMRSPGSTLNGFACYGNLKGGLNVALRATGISSHDMTISNGVVLNNGPSALSDAYEVSIGNTDRLSMSNVIIGSNSLKFGMKILGSTYVQLSNVQIRGTHAAYTSCLQMGVLGTNRCRQVSLNGCTFEHPGPTGNVLVVQDVDGFYLNGGKISVTAAGNAFGVRYLGTVTDSVIAPTSWGNIFPINRISDGSTVLTGHRMVSPVTLAAAIPSAGLWAQGEEVRNSAMAVGSPKSWVCTTAGGASSAAWAATTAYVRGQWIRGATTGVWECTVSGTSGSTEPTGNIGDTVVDGTVTWVKRYSNFATFVSTGNL